MRKDCVVNQCTEHINYKDFSKWRTLNKYYFLLIAILEADLRYNNNINIVYNDTDDVVTNRRWFTYIEKEIMAEDLIQILSPRPRS